MVKGPVTDRKFSRRQIRLATIIAAGVISVVLLLSGGWYFYSSAKQSAHEESQQTLEKNARSLVTQLAKPFDAISTQLKALAKDETTISLFEQGDIGFLDAEADNRQGDITSALKLRFLLLGNYPIDNVTKPPLTYASLDILKRAEKSSGAIGADVLLLGSPDQHIVMVERVKNKAGELIGMLHLSLDVELFKQALDEAAQRDDLWWQVRALQELGWEDAVDELVLANAEDI